MTFYLSKILPPEKELTEVLPYLRRLLGSLQPIEDFLWGTVLYFDIARPYSYNIAL